MSATTLSRPARAKSQIREIGGQTFSVVQLFDLDPDYRREPETEHFCSLCQRDIKTPKSETQFIHFVDGGTWILATADEDRYAALSALQAGGQFSGEMGIFAIGPECARKLPKGFVLPAKTLPDPVKESA